MSLWSVWGNADRPIQTGLDEDGARAALRTLEQAGRDDVYAESEDGDVLETSTQK